MQTLDSVEEINVDLIQNYCEYIWPPTDDLRLNRLRRKYCARGGVLISTIDAHLALLCVLQLRTTCGLRGIRPSRLFGCDVIASLCSRGTLENSSIEIDMNGPSGESTVDAHWEEIRSVRSEFIVQCFRQLGSTRSATLYRLSALWLYSLHEVRIMHVNVLLELYLDELVDEMIPQVTIED